MPILYVLLSLTPEWVNKMSADYQLILRALNLTPDRCSTTYGFFLFSSLRKGAERTE